MNLRKLAEKWKRDAAQYQRQVDEARVAGTPHDQMLAGATFLRQCAKELETELGGPARHPEDFCDDCGGLNVTWFTSNEIWNLVVRKPDAPDPMLCPRCFILRAQKADPPRVWRVAPEQ